MKQICKTYATIYKKYARNMQEIYTNMHSICKKNAQICMKYVFNMQGICINMHTYPQICTNMLKYA